MSEEQKNNQDKSVLNEFWAFTKDFKSVTSWIAKMAVAAPLLDIVLNIGPPWPSRISVSMLICISEIIIIMYSFEFWKNKSTRIKHVRSVLKCAIGIFAFLLIVYMSLFSFFIMDAFDSRHRWLLDTITVKTFKN